jgi:dipeptidyl aminopeptidase/acylaminoacyl peptidase
VPLLERSGLAVERQQRAHQTAVPFSFPSENHWVLNPQHAKIWYQVVTAFLARHVLGDDVELPETLG